MSLCSILEDKIRVSHITDHHCAVHTNREQNNYVNCSYLTINVDALSKTLTLDHCDHIKLYVNRCPVVGIKLYKCHNVEVEYGLLSSPGSLEIYRCGNITVEKPYIQGIQCIGCTDSRGVKANDTYISDAYIDSTWEL